MMIITKGFLSVWFIILYNYHLLNIESILADTGAAEIYTYNSKYSPTSTEGKLKGKPVAVEYLGKDYKSIVLSFPLYFIKKEDAKLFINNALKRIGIQTGIDIYENKQIPVNFVLSQNYPNPFNPATAIHYSIPFECKVNLTVYNSIGQKITELLNTTKQPGVYEVIFDGRALPSGVYFYTFSAGGFVQTKKIALIK